MKYLKIFIVLIILIVAGFYTAAVFAAPITSNADENSANAPITENGELIPGVNITIGGENGTASTIQLLLLVTIITLAPSILIMFTCFTRVIVVLHFIRAAMGTQTIPPNQVVVGLAVFITLLIMSPTIEKINTDAYEPYNNGEITQEEFIDKAMVPIREFMFGQVEDKDLVLFTNLTGETYEFKDDIPNSVLIPAFVLGEITKGFKIGFVIYIPFIVIDMVVASTLMAMGMMMLPPALISAPFKLLLFILVDGWGLIIGNLVKTFY